MSKSNLLSDILDSLPHSKGHRIATAKHYVSGIEPCLTGGGLCPTKLFNLADSSLWQKELDASAGRLVYCEDDGSELMRKSIRDGADITQGAILEYDAILATRQKDRDGDIVEPKGMALDLNMPLLWQHLQLQPIGKHISVVGLDDNSIRCKFAIADIPLGRDAATLVRMGALRKSHGFVPSDAAPIEKYKGMDGKEYVKGWHIKSCSVMEGSLVSIPANPGTGITTIYAKQFDGVVTAYSRNMLEDPLMQQWAKGFFEMRPKTFQGIGDGAGRTIVKKSGVSVSVGSGNVVSVDGVRVEVEKGGYAAKPGEGEEKPRKRRKLRKPPMENEDRNKKEDGEEKELEKAAKKRKCPQCGSEKIDHTGTCTNCGHFLGVLPAKPDKPGAPEAPKSAGDIETKMYGMSDNHLEGSMEWTKDKLDDRLYSYLVSQGVEVADRWNVDIIATFAAEAIVCVRDYSKSPAEKKCYRLSWSAGDNGPKWSGEPQEVEIKAVVLEKAFDVLVRGRKAAEKHITLPEQANDLCAKAIFSTDDDASETLRALESAAGLIRDQLELKEFQALMGE